ncbi:MAG: hypothetical protein HON65_10020 [Rhodospirillales bacterium]|jgi:hypothetical protein|nr:hypothetical protein [Rhodospirillales bacterium]
MKAESYIFTGLHKPLTVFGLPPLLLALSGAALGVSFALLIILDLTFLALPVSIFLFIVIVGFFARKTSQDHHFVNLLAVPPRFWRGRKARTLIVGIQPEKKGKKNVE